jgi:hypothetical protein
MYKARTEHETCLWSVEIYWFGLGLSVVLHYVPDSGIHLRANPAVNCWAIAINAVVLRTQKAALINGFLIPHLLDHICPTFNCRNPCKSVRSAQSV